MATTSKVRAQFTLPELHDDKLIDWDAHVTSNLGAHDMIIGRDILEFLKKIDTCFSDHTVRWLEHTMPFKDGEAKVADSHCVQDDPNLAEASDCLKKILDAKYEQADLEEICCNQDQLSTAEQQKLLQLLNKCATLFRSTLSSNQTLHLTTHVPTHCQDVIWKL